MTADLVGLADLKPCPWCKGQPKGVGYQGQPAEWYFVNCVCGAHGPEYDDPESAITAWNTRSELRALAGAEVGGWISVEDRLPEDDERVLVVAATGWGGSPQKGLSWFKRSTGKFDDDGVTHWQSFPPPPGSGRGGVGDA